MCTGHIRVLVEFLYCKSQSGYFVVFLQLSRHRQKAIFRQVKLVFFHVLINLIFTIIFPTSTNDICTYLEFFSPSLESW